jgi:hypothetical protein
MKHYKEVEIPASKKQKQTHASCDICKRSDERNPRVDYCDIDETEISFRDVEMAFPECGKGKTYSYDICHDCFAEKVIPALSDLGAEPAVEEWDY